MFNKDYTKNMAYEILVFFVTFAVVMFVLRVWPVLLLMILSIFAAALKLLYRRTAQVEIILPMFEELLPIVSETEKDVLNSAFHLIQQRITAEVVSTHPSIRWQWHTPNPLANIERGDSVIIVLNGAGGYRKAIVVIHNLMFQSLEYETVQEAILKKDVSTTENIETENEDVLEETLNSEPENEVTDVVNYEYLAFEWVDARLLMLNERGNEAIAQGENTLLIPESELPVRESWGSICKELIKNDFDDALPRDDGILVSLQQ